jgi:hypothetical protein
MVSAIYAACHYDECHSAECHSVISKQEGQFHRQGNKSNDAGVSIDLIIKDFNLGKGKHCEKKWLSDTPHNDIHPNYIPRKWFDFDTDKLKHSE